MGMATRVAARRGIAMLAVATAIAVVAPTYAGAETAYNSFPASLPKNMPSVGFEATSTSEFGGAVELAPNTARRHPTVTVAMSSWACQSGTWFGDNCSSYPGSTFNWPVTLRLYNLGPGNTVGSLITSVTQTFSMPYRPNASKKCTTGSARGGYAPPTCYHGKLFKIVFGLPSITLPEQAILSVAYNTSDYGAQPQRPKACDSTEAGCPYDSLNVAVHESSEPGPAVGSYPDEEEVFVNSSWSEMYCGNALATGSFGPSGACWPKEQPVLLIKAMK
jgi:hypothetical protein